MKRISLLSLKVAILGGVLIAAQTSRAITIGYHIDVNTSALVGNSGAPFSLDFQLNDGLGTGDGNNTATINNFTFGSGSAFGSPILFGGASGTFGIGITLKDTSPFNEFYQTFNAGNSLAFDLFLTMNNESVATPDLFLFSILDSGLGSIPTTGFADSFLAVNLGAQKSSIITGFSSDPVVTFSVSSVPDSGSSAALFLIALVALGQFRRTLQRTTSQQG